MSENSESDEKQSKWPLIISGIIILSLIALYFISPDFKSFINNAYDVLTSDDEKRISNWVEQFGLLGPLIIVVAMVAQMFLLVIPSFLLMIISVLAYGPFWGSLIILASVFVASSLGYFLGSFFGEITIQKLLGKKSESKVEGYVNEYGLWAVFIARISPLLSNDAISFVAGLLNLSYIKFIGATMAGIIPLTILIAILGNDFDRLTNGLIWISVISVVGLIIYIIYDKKNKKVLKNS